MRQGYDRETADTWNASLHWRFDADNYLHVSAGHNLSFLGGPTEYASVDSRMDGTRGILFFVEHLF
jgi:hypothetical protein